MPYGFSVDSLRASTLENFDVSLAKVLSKVSDEVFRIGHLGDFNDLMLVATLTGVEMGLTKSKVQNKAGREGTAMNILNQ